MPTMQASPAQTGMSSRTSKIARRFRALAPERRDIKLERLLNSDDGHSLELVDGQLVKKPDMGGIACVASNKLAYFLTGYVLKQKNGYIISSEATYKCFSGDKLTIRKPDISFVKKGRFPNEEIPDGSILIPPDLAVEVISKYDTINNLERKLKDFSDAGVFETWLVIPAERLVLVCKQNGVRIRLNEQATLSCEDLLPGFALKVSEIFE